jgi:heme exporter protein D
VSSLHEFLTMGGYGMYVWPAYGLAALVVAVNVIVPSLRLKHLREEIHKAGGKP